MWARDVFLLSLIFQKLQIFPQPCKYDNNVGQNSISALTRHVIFLIGRWYVFFTLLEFSLWLLFMQGYLFFFVCPFGLHYTQELCNYYEKTNISAVKSIWFRAQVKASLNLGFRLWTAGSNRLLTQTPPSSLPISWERRVHPNIPRRSERPQKKTI